jgi:hypothetical protein
VDVSPRNENPGTITIQGFWESDILTPVRYPEENITCFLSNRDITLTANPKDGYQFEYWEFSLWPQDLNESTDRTSNPITFRNINYDYPDSNYARVITAHFTRIAGPPPAPQNVSFVQKCWHEVSPSGLKLKRFFSNLDTSSEQTGGIMCENGPPSSSSEHMMSPPRSGQEA